MGGMVNSRIINSGVRCKKYRMDKYGFFRGVPVPVLYSQRVKAAALNGRFLVAGANLEGHIDRVKVLKHSSCSWCDYCT